MQERNHLSSHSVRGVCSTRCIKGKEKVVFEIKDEFSSLAPVKKQMILHFILIYFSA